MSIPFFQGSSLDSSFEATRGWRPPNPPPPPTIGIQPLGVGYQGIPNTQNGPLGPRYMPQDETPDQTGTQDYGRTARIVNLPPRTEKPRWYTFGIDLGLPIIGSRSAFHQTSRVGTSLRTQLGVSDVPSFTTRLVVRILRPTIGPVSALQSGSGTPPPTPQLEWFALARYLWNETQVANKKCMMPMLYGYFDPTNPGGFSDSSPHTGPLWHQHTWYMHEHRPGIPLEQIFDHLSAADRRRVLDQIAGFIKTIQTFGRTHITSIAQDRPGHMRLETRDGARTVVGSVDYRTMIIEKFGKALEDAENHPFTRWVIQTIPENDDAADGANSPSLRERLQRLLDDYSQDQTVRRVFESEGLPVLVHGQLTWLERVSLL